MNKEPNSRGVTCGAGMPYKLADIAAKYKCTIITLSSLLHAPLTPFEAIHQRSRSLGGVVYEDPWKAGGHNGLLTPKIQSPQKPLSAYLTFVSL